MASISNQEALTQAQAQLSSSRSKHTCKQCPPFKVLQFNKLLKFLKHTQCVYHLQRLRFHGKAHRAPVSCGSNFQVFRATAHNRLKLLQSCYSSKALQVHLLVETNWSSTSTVISHTDVMIKHNPRVHYPRKPPETRLHSWKTKALQQLKAPCNW